jgi:hypothetical protein
MTHIIFRRLCSSWEDIWQDVVLIVVTLPISVGIAAATMFFVVISVHNPLFLLCVFSALCFDIVFVILYSVTIRDIMRELRD